MIHSLGPLLVPIEWAFIFLPMMFHAAVGFVIIANGLPNAGSYPYVSNVRYTLQRATGMIAFVFIVWHLWQLHALGKPFGGGNHLGPVDESDGHAAGERGQRARRHRLGSGRPGGGGRIPILGIPAGSPHRRFRSPGRAADARVALPLIDPDST